MLKLRQRYIIGSQQIRRSPSRSHEQLWARKGAPIRCFMEQNRIREESGAMLCMIAVILASNTRWLFRPREEVSDTVHLILESISCRKRKPQILFYIWHIRVRFRKTNILHTLIAANLHIHRIRGYELYMSPSGSPARGIQPYCPMMLDEQADHNLICYGGAASPHLHSDNAWVVFPVLICNPRESS